MYPTNLSYWTNLVTAPENTAKTLFLNSKNTSVHNHFIHTCISTPVYCIMYNFNLTEELKESYNTRHCIKTRYFSYCTLLLPFIKYKVFYCYIYCFEFIWCSSSMCNYFLSIRQSDGNPKNQINTTTLYKAHDSSL